MVHVTPNGAALRAIREARELSLRDLGEMAGMNASYLSQIERGERDPRPETVQRIAQALGVPEDAITRGTTVQTDDDELRLYTVPQVADLWGISASWIYKAAAAREIEVTYLTLPGRSKGLLRLSRRQVKQILDGFTVNPATRGRQLAKTA